MFLTVAVMSSRFSWNGTILSASLAGLEPLIWYELPAGPSWAAPFDRPSWRLYTADPAYNGIYLECIKDEPTFPSDRVCQMRIQGESGVEDSDPIEVTVRAEWFTQNGGQGARIRIPGDQGSKFATKKVLQFVFDDTNTPVALPSVQDHCELTAHGLTGMSCHDYSVSQGDTAEWILR